MKQIRELQKDLFEVVEAAGDKRDYRFQSWAKTIERVDQSATNGYAFVGDFVRSGTVEVEIAPRAYLVMTTAGSRQYQTATYRVVVMDAAGALAATDIVTTSATPGWALRIRDRVAELLQALQQQEAPDPLADVETDALIAELARRGYTVSKS